MFEFNICFSINISYLILVLIDYKTGFQEKLSLPLILLQPIAVPGLFIWISSSSEVSLTKRMKIVARNVRNSVRINLLVEWIWCHVKCWILACKMWNQLKYSPYLPVQQRPLLRIILYIFLERMRWERRNCLCFWIWRKKKKWIKMKFNLILNVFCNACVI